jgi:hypothetical protein
MRILPLARVTVAFVTIACACADSRGPLDDPMQGRFEPGHEIPRDEEARLSRVERAIVALLRVRSDLPVPAVDDAIRALTLKRCDPTHPEDLVELTVDELYDTSRARDISFVAGCGELVLKDGAKLCGPHFLKTKRCFNRKPL